MKKANIKRNEPSRFKEFFHQKFMRICRPKRIFFIRLYFTTFAATEKNLKKN